MEGGMGSVPDQNLVGTAIKHVVDESIRAKKIEKTILACIA